ncbi:MAG: HAD-IA family hydrolase [bacterium]
MQPSALLVDLDGTLYAARPVKLAMALALVWAGPRTWAVIRAFRRQHERIRDEELDAPEGAFALQIEATARELGREASAIEAVVHEWMIRRPLPWLRRFRRQSLIAELRAFAADGGRLALVSDYPAREKLAALGLDDLFEVVVASGEAGGPTRLKPAPDGYLAAARALGVEARECLVLGDRDDVDGAAARAAGMGFRLVP